MAELPKFLDNEFPNAVSGYLAYPQSFDYKQEALKKSQGFPREAKTRFSRPAQRGPKDREQKSEEQWKGAALGDLSEAKTFRVLETLFQSRPSLMMSGVKTEKILQVARQSAKYSVTQSKKQNPGLFSVPLTNEERMLAGAFGLDLEQLEAQIKELIALASSGADISKDDLVAAIEMKTVRPAFEHLDEGQKGKYTNTLSKEIDLMFNKSKRKLSPDEVGHHLTRYFLNLVEKKDEFDFFLADKMFKSFIQVEVKSYPQEGIPEKEGLTKALKKANEQLGKGDLFFQNVLVPAARLSSSWTKLNIVCLPEITNRQQLKSLGVEESSLKFIMTAEELGSLRWPEDMGSPDSPASNEEYKRLLAICVGSQHVAFDCQVFDAEAEHQKTQKLIVGQKRSSEVAGIGQGEGIEDGRLSINLSDLADKPLGHTWSILFWTQEQLNLLDKLRSGENIVLCGDYGTGKTSLLVFAALEAAKDPNCRVFFVPATNIFNPTEDNAGYVLDEAVKMKFEGSGVEVVTIGDIRQPYSVRKTFWEDSRLDDRHQLIRELSKIENEKSTPAKFFIDELPVFHKDLEGILDGKGTQMSETLQTIESQCSQAWIALSTLSLLDNSEALDKPRQPEIKTKTQNALKSGFSHERKLTLLTKDTTFMLHTLNLRVRNSSSIGACAPQEMSELGRRSDKNTQTSVIAEASVSTVVGMRPTFIHMGGGLQILDKDYNMGLKEALVDVLKMRKNPGEHAVIICGEGISVETVSKTTTKMGFSPTTVSQKPINEKYQHQQLQVWLKSKGGLLVTSDLQFAGIEAPTCVFITNNIIEETGARSGLLRATSRLVVVSYTKDINLEAVRSRFLVRDASKNKVKIADEKPGTSSSSSRQPPAAERKRFRVRPEQRDQKLKDKKVRAETLERLKKENERMKKETEAHKSSLQNMKAILKEGGIDFQDLDLSG